MVAATNSVSNGQKSNTHFLPHPNFFLQLNFNRILLFAKHLLSETLSWSVVFGTPFGWIVRNMNTRALLFCYTLVSSCKSGKNFSSLFVRYCTRDWASCLKTSVCVSHSGLCWSNKRRKGKIGQIEWKTEIAISVIWSYPHWCCSIGMRHRPLAKYSPLAYIEHILHIVTRLAD